MEGKRLILNFDVNKTIIMCDRGAGVENVAMLNSLLSECVYGTIRQGTDRATRGPTDWILESLEPTTVSPEDSNLVTFGEYLENHTCMTKGERVPYKRRFTEERGMGEKFKSCIDEMIRHLTPSDEAISIAAQTNCPFISDGSIHIVPAFFELIIELNKRGWDFRIVFRTFGNDTEKVAEEFNLFCCGLHPCYPNVLMNGENGTTDRRLKIPEYSGMLNRYSSSSDGVIFAFVNGNKLVEISCGHRGFSDAIDGWIASGAYTMAIRDHFEWWRDCHESDDSGKLFVINSESRESCISIFFDDNIERDRSHIVDVRDESFAPVPFAESNGKYIFRVQPYDIIAKRDYFINRVDECIAAQLVDLG